MRPCWCGSFCNVRVLVRTAETTAMIPAAYEPRACASVRMKSPAFLPRRHIDVKIADRSHG